MGSFGVGGVPSRRSVQFCKFSGDGRVTRAAGGRLGGCGDAYGDYGREGVTELARGGCQWGQRNGSGLFVQGVRV